MPMKGLQFLYMRAEGVTILNSFHSIHDLPLGFISRQSCLEKQKHILELKSIICMYFSSVGHTESCKIEKKSLVFLGADRLSHFLFYLSLLILIKILLVFWSKAKIMSTWRHLRHRSPHLFSSLGLGGLSIQMPVIQVLPSWMNLGHPNFTLSISYMKPHIRVRTKQIDNKSEFSFPSISMQ